MVVIKPQTDTEDAKWWGGGFIEISRGQIEGILADWARANVDGWSDGEIKIYFGVNYDHELTDATIVRT